MHFKKMIMKKYKFLLVSLVSLVFAACSGEKADQEHADSMNKYTDTNYSTVDTNSVDSARTKDFPDSTTNAPRMSGGKGKVE
ncbi:hypothetical protein [Pedobacter jamesrossensis]|uniref:Lipoprotein n=1 Tax=Pedobacter jamesrossensis TaxID=1908238 RepID=A0ABV8NN20_9SPHI